eukprot:366252-Chlamydomonas_euryale.AAC.9
MPVLHQSTPIEWPEPSMISGALQRCGGQAACRHVGRHGMPWVEEGWKKGGGRVAEGWQKGGRRVEKGWETGGRRDLVERQ